METRDLQLNIASSSKNNGEVAKESKYHGRVEDLLNET